MSSARFEKIAISFAVVVLISVLALPVGAQLVDDFWVDEIETYLIQVDMNTTAEIVIVVVPSLVGHGIEDEGAEITDIVKLGVYIFNELPLETLEGDQVGIGKEGKDNGLLILVAVEEKQWRIEVGYGLEGDITDIESHDIAEQYLTPKLAIGELGEGLYDTVVALSEKIPTTEEQLPIRGLYIYESTETSEPEPIPDWVIILIIVLVIAFGGTVGGFGGVWRRTGSKRTTGGRSGGGGSRGNW
jgi:uncharacterized protein